MSKLTGNQEFNGDVYIKGVGDYTGDNPSSATPLQEVIQTSLSKIDAFTSHGVSSIVALTESEYAALTTKDATTLYIVKPNPFPLTGTGTQDDPIVGWYENVAVVINPNELSNGDLSGSLPGIFNFVVDVFSTLEHYVYFSYNGTVNLIQNTGLNGDYYSLYAATGGRAPGIFNTNTKQLGWIEIRHDDTILFHLLED